MTVFFLVNPKHDTSHSLNHIYIYIYIYIYVCMYIYAVYISVRINRVCALYMLDIKNNKKRL